MTWNPLKIPEAKVKGYVMQWKVDDEDMNVIVLGKVNKYTIRDLQPGQTVQASVCARFDRVVYRNGSYPTFCSLLQNASMPANDEGWLV